MNGALLEALKGVFITGKTRWSDNLIPIRSLKFSQYNSHINSVFTWMSVILGDPLNGSVHPAHHVLSDFCLLTPSGVICV